MKHLLTLLVALIIATAAVEAQSQFAVLDHQGTLTAYYGSSAFASAYEASIDGDIITLSPGNFNAYTTGYSTYFTKGITIRGAGYAYDNTAHTEATTIEGTIYFYASDSNNVLKIEGISFVGTQYGLCKYAKFNKCSFGSFNNDGTDMNNTTFINCCYSDLTIGSGWSNNQFINCIIGGWLSYSSSVGQNNTFANCYISLNTSTPTWLSSLNIYNSIIDNISSSSSYPLNNVQSIYNCIGIWSRGTFFSAGTTTHHLYNLSSSNGLIKSYNTYELVDSLQTVYVGNDGTQIGPAGGNFPFNSSVHHPRLGNIVPALQTRPDGKLEVEVEILSEE